MSDVSVIVPALNEEKYIRPTLKSICAQNTEFDFELIVSDGFSSDKTVSISEKYADKIVYCKTKGIWAGRNAGGNAAKSKLLVFIDSDTIIPPNYLDSVHAVMRNNSVFGLSCAFTFDENTAPLRTIRDASNYYLMALGLAGKGELLGFNCVMRKKDFLKVGGFPDAPLEDGAMARLLHKLGRVIYLPEPVVTTSARRMSKGGTLKSVKYYADLMVGNYSRQFKFGNLLRYCDYKPIR